MRRKQKYNKRNKPDIKFNSVSISRFINYLMRTGDKTTAENVLYNALSKVKKETELDPIAVFEKAIENASPLIEVVSKRVGGANYQVPKEVRPERRFFLACKWIIEAAKSKKGRPMKEKLAEEFIAAFKNEGTAIKKKQNVHRMAEANRAFAHFAR